MVMPMIRSSRAKARLTERVAQFLSCPVAEVAVHVEGNTVTAKGCGIERDYLIVCRPVEREECLVLAAEVPRP